MGLFITQKETNFKMKKNKITIVLATTIAISLSFLFSCTSEINKDEEIISSKYRLDEFSKKTSLTNFAANHAIYNISLSKLEANKYKVITESYDLSTINKTLKNNYFITLTKNSVALETNVNGKFYRFIKNDIKNEASFQVKDQVFLLDDLFFQSISKEDDDVLNKLVSIFIELYDNNAKRLNSNATKKVANLIAGKSVSSCLKFESAIGATATASKLRASIDTKEYISDGNSDCKAIGSDTSCAIDGHVCVTTVTMACSSSCSWWN
jgi:hypothetical protein